MAGKSSDWVLFWALDKQKLCKNAENVKDVNLYVSLDIFIRVLLRFMLSFNLPFRSNRRFKKSSLCESSALIYKVLKSVTELFLISFKIIN